MRQLLLLLLPTLTLASIQIDLTATVHSKNISSHVNSKGFEERVIAEQDRASLGIQDELLKLAIEKINGKKPDEVYVTSKTPFGDLYTRYGWKQIHLKIQPVNNDLFCDYKSDTAKLSKTKYENKNSRPRDTLINESGNLTNTIYSYWMYAAANISGGAVTIKFNFNTDDISAYFDKTFAFGANIKYIQNRYYETNATVRLEPGQKVTAELEALQKSIKVVIPYEISLSGDVIAKYNEMHKDKYFFKFDINEIRKANNITTTRRLQQILTYQALSDANIHIRDAKDIILRSIPAEGRVSTKGLKKATNRHHDKAEGVPVTRKKMEFDIPADLVIETVHSDNREESEEDKEEPETVAKEENKES